VVKFEPVLNLEWNENDFLENQLSRLKAIYYTHIPN
jgi:hypothetical protein